MSGSAGRSGSGGGFASDNDDCASLRFETQLSSPVAAVVSSLKKGNVLQVQAVAAGTSTVAVVFHDGRKAGGLASPRVTLLLECMAKGAAYEAEVLSVVSGQVRVAVRAA